jgi:hypothetical protein
MRLEDAVSAVASRLGDLDNKSWTRAELALYLQDGYDAMCHDGAILFDTVVIPNLPPIGSYGTDLQKYLAQHTPGIRIMDNRLNVTQDPEMQMGVGGQYAPSYDMPVTSGEGEASA